MKTVTINLFDIDELAPPARDVALNWMYENFHFSWSDEYNESLKKFCDAVGIRVVWSSDAWNNFHFSRNRKDWNDALRGKSIKDFDRDYMPTGFCADCSLWQTFYDSWKNSGSPVVAIEKALTNFFNDWKSDIEYHYSSETMIDNANANSYTFLEDGTFFSSPVEA